MQVSKWVYSLFVQLSYAIDITIIHLKKQQCILNQSKKPYVKNSQISCTIWYFINLLLIYFSSHLVNVSSNDNANHIIIINDTTRLQRL